MVRDGGDPLAADLAFGRQRHHPRARLNAVFETGAGVAGRVVGAGAQQQRQRQAGQGAEEDGGDVHEGRPGRDASAPAFADAAAGTATTGANAG